MRRYSIEELAPCVLSIDNAVQNSSELIEFAKTFDYWQDAVVGDDNRIDDIRSNRVLPLIIENNKPSLWFNVASTFWQFADVYARKFHAYHHEMEKLQMLHYRNSNDHYGLHSDDDLQNTSRIFSMILYLNNVEQGGETYFPNFDLTIQPKEGTLIVFPANFVYAHAANPPTKGEKYAIVTWFNKLTQTS